MTTFVRLPSHARRLGVARITVADGSVLPSGTVKDYRSERVLQDAQEEWYANIIIITSGNAGFSLALLSKEHNITLHCVMDKHVQPALVERLRRMDAVVHLVDLHDHVLEEQELLDICGLKRAFFADKGYKHAYEPLKEAIEKYGADVVVCPIGSGELFLALHESTKFRTIGVRNEEVPSVADKLWSIWTPYEKELAERSEDIISLSEQEILEAFEIGKEFMDCEVSSAVVFSPKIPVRQEESVVLVNTGYEKGLENPSE